MGMMKKIRDFILGPPISLEGEKWGGLYTQGLKDGMNKPTIPIDEFIEELMNPRPIVKPKEDSIMIDHNHETKLGGTEMERKNNDTLEVYEELLEVMHQTYISKNADYGNSFGVSLDKRGLVAALVRMEDKMNRLDKLKDGEHNLVGESLMDTALDLANYALMTAVWLKQQEKETYKVYANDKVVAEFPKELGEHDVKIDQGVLTSDGEINIKSDMIGPTEITVNPYPTPIKGTNINIQGNPEVLEDEVIKKLVRESLESYEKGRGL